MSIRCEKLKMIEKSIQKKCIDAKNANSNFSDLIKICQKIKSISMRKNQIFSTLFVFLNRISALQNRKCNNCIIRFLETILCDFIVVFVQYAFSKRYYLISSNFEYVIVLINTLFRNYIVFDCVRSF